MFLNECLAGFIIQKTNFSFEVLIHDDASTDNSQEIILEYCEKYPEVIKPILQKENQYSKGVSNTWRYNIPRAKGKYIALCEGDDYWTDPLKLQKQVDFLEANPEYSYCYHPWQIYNEEEQKLEPKIFNNDRTLTLLFRKFNIENPQIFSEVKNGDNVLKYLLSKYGKSKFIKDIAPAIHRHHKGGVWSLKSEEYKIKNRLITAEKLLIYYPEKITRDNLLRLLIDIQSFEKSNNVKILEDSLYNYLKERKILYWYFRYRLALYKVKLLSYFKK